MFSTVWVRLSQAQVVTVRMSSKKLTTELSTDAFANYDFGHTELCSNGATLKCFSLSTLPKCGVAPLEPADPCGRTSAFTHAVCDRRDAHPLMLDRHISEAPQISWGS